jgi:hypothetical protein
MIPKSIPDSVFQITGFLSMKMGMGIVSNVRSNPFRASGGNFGYVRGKGFKTENIVDYTCRRRWFFSWKEREAYSSIERMKSILRFVSSR